MVLIVGVGFALAASKKEPDANPETPPAPKKTETYLRYLGRICLILAIAALIIRGMVAASQLMR